MQCTRCIAQQGQNLEEEEDHLVKAIVGNAYPHSLIHSASVARPPREDDGEREEETPPTDLLSYEGCKDFNIRAAFTPRPTLSSLLTKVKDPLPPPYGEGSKCHLQSAMHLWVERCRSVRLLCQLGTRLKEHKDACIKGFMDKCAIAKHAWTEDRPIHWDDTRILQHAT